LVTKRTDFEKKYKKGRLITVIRRLALALIITVVILFIAVSWLTPEIIRRKTEQILSGICDGPVRIENVQINPSGEVFFENIKFYDKEKQRWLLVEKLKAILTNWPSFRPVIKEIQITGLNLLVTVAGGELYFPADTSSNQSLQKSDYFDLQQITVYNASIGVADKKDSKIACNYLSIQPAEQEGFYNILLTASKPDEPKTNRASLKGIINPTSTEARLSVQMNLKAKEQETAVLFAALGMPDVSGEGKLVADLTIAGLLNEPTGLLANGSVKIDESVLYIKDQVFAKDLVTTAVLEEQSFHVDEFNAVVCGGSVNGSVYIEAKQNQPIAFGGQFFAEKMSFVELTSFLGGTVKKASKGSVSFEYYFTAIETDLENLSGDGRIFLDDADLTVLPIIPYLFKFMGLEKLDPLKISDVECTFGMTGPVVEIKNAHIANPFGAIEAEPGGKINLQTGNVDMYVIAVPLKYLDNLVRHIPLADIIFNLKDKLTRFYVRGHWSSSPSKLITKTPIKDIKEGTIGFFQDVAKTGGQIGQEMLKGLRLLLPGKQNNKN
jgi:hypothetical protein